MSSNESAAYEIMRTLDVDYVLVIFGGVIGFSGDDINKFLWMVRIAEGEHPRDIRVCCGTVGSDCGGICRGGGNISSVFFNTVGGVGSGCCCIVDGGGD